MKAPTIAGIGVDIGGTFTRVALVDCGAFIPAWCGTGILPVSSRAGSPCHTDSSDRLFARVLAQRRWPTSETPSLDELLDRVAHAIRELTKNRRELSDNLPIGMAIPGTLNEPRDRVVRCVNVAFLEDWSAADALLERLRRPVTLCTDAEAATWAEYLNVARTSLEHFPSSCSEPRASARAIPADSTQRDVGIGPRRFVHLRIGTGVACGAVIDGALVRLDENRETHPPFLVVDDTATAATCRCGLRGCLESIASGFALEAGARELGLVGGIPALEAAWQRSLDAGTASDASLASAVELVRRAGEAVGTAIALVADRFRAEVVCLGGGVIMNLPCLMECAIDRYQQSAKFREQEPPIITRANLGDEAGVIGAALLGARAAHPAT